MWKFVTWAATFQPITQSQQPDGNIQCVINITANLLYQIRWNLLCEYILWRRERNYNLKLLAQIHFSHWSYMWIFQQQKMACFQNWHTQRQKNEASSVLHDWKFLCAELFTFATKMLMLRNTILSQPCQFQRKSRRERQREMRAERWS